MKILIDKTKAWISPLLALFVCLLTILGWVSLYPPFNVSEVAYVFLIPLILWFLSKPNKKDALWVLGSSGFISWLILLIWLRHVTYIGTVLLSAVLALFWVAWGYAAWWSIPKIICKSGIPRLIGIAGLAGVWVILEWLRNWIFTGFPWLPLAASQWQRPAVLQIIATTGTHGLAFILVYFNIGIAFYLRHLIKPKKHTVWYQRLSPEFYSSFGLIFLLITFLMGSGFFHRDRKPLFHAALVQPYINPTIKWDEDKAYDILESLKSYTQYASALDPHIIFYPESVTPWPAIGYPQMSEWLKELSEEVNTPFIMGTTAIEGDLNDENSRWYNAVVMVTRENGVIENPYYAKRKLVPFGEYIPFHNLISFIDKIVPIGSFYKGTHPINLPINLNGKNVNIGSLICYENIFPNLARETVAHGATLLFVSTNDAWYGEEAGAYQHAAHSVLRAVETRRPVVCCGNAGWSGWIDEYGNIRYYLSEPEKDIYFSGVQKISISQDPSWAGKMTPYVQYGDWFVILSTILAVLGFLALSQFPDQEMEEEKLTAREKARRLLSGGKFKR